jgi:DNA-directed RNA polymerase subunit L
MYPSYGTGRQHSRWHSSVAMYKFATETDLDVLKDHKIPDVIDIVNLAEIKEPKNGDRYIAETTVEKFSEGYVYEYNDNKWDEYVPNINDAVTVTKQKQYLVFMDDHWVHRKDVESNSDQQKYLGYEQKLPTHVIMTIESIGKFSSVSVLRRGIDALKSTLVSTLHEFANIDASNKVSMDYNNNTPNFAKFRILDEEHTLGLLLDCSCLNKLKELIIQSLPEEEKTDKNAILQVLLQCICGYRKTHPLDNFIELIIRTPLDHKLPIPPEYAHLNVPLGLVIVAVQDAITLCDRLLQEVSSLFKN